MERASDKTQRKQIHHHDQVAGVRALVGLADVIDVVHVSSEIEIEDRYDAAVQLVREAHPELATQEIANRTFSAWEKPSEERMK